MEPHDPNLQTTVPAPAAVPGKGKAVTILVLGIFALVCCQVLGPVAWLMGSSELKAIAAGRSARENETVVRVGWILGIVATVLFVISCIWMFFFGGMAILGSLTGN